MSETAAGAQAAQTATRRVLLCGGHMDGQWINLPTREYEFRSIRPARSSEEDVVVYVVQVLPLAIPGSRGGLWIGVPTVLFGSERNEAIMRAVLQRDVAQQLMDQR